MSESDNINEVEQVQSTEAAAEELELTDEQKQIKKLQAQLEEAKALMKPFTEIMSRYEFNELNQASPVRQTPEDEENEAVFIQTSANRVLLTFGQIKALAKFVEDNTEVAPVETSMDEDLANLLDF